VLGGLLDEPWTEGAAVEMNFDGLVGPTHNFAGLAFGNVASTKNARQLSSPRAAVLEGLAKMAAVHALGVPQGLLPPQERPRLDVLRRLGFEGDDGAVVGRAAREAPGLLASVYSASAMWAANAATVSPSADTRDGRVHLTAANLVSSLHRSLEAESTGRALRRIFAGERFVVHDALPACETLGDEGAANHTRLHDGGAGLEVFVYGRAAGGARPRRFPARQTREASEAVARLHGVRRALFVRQNPEAIDAGAFHNDVVAVGHERVLLWHEDAFADASDIETMRRELAEEGVELLSWRVSRKELSLSEAIETYLFNSQIVTTEAGWVLVAPAECERSAAARSVIARLTTEGLASVRFLEVRQSMRNGGGPACLRLRVELTDAEREEVKPTCVFTPALHRTLVAWAQRHYRETLAPADLADPALIEESRAALDELTQILDLGGDFYDFQR